MQKVRNKKRKGKKGKEKEEKGPNHISVRPQPLGQLAIQKSYRRGGGMEV